MFCRLAALTLVALGSQSAFAQCAPAPDSAYFFRDLSEKRAEAKIAESRAVYEELLSDTFTSRNAEGKPVTKREYIDWQLTAGRTPAPRRFYSVSNYTLVEHRKGYTVATYLLTEGATGKGPAQVTESQMREVYEVVDGKWRLASVESSPLPPDAAATSGRTP
jgi:hypothetical protein